MLAHVPIWLRKAALHLPAFSTSREKLKFAVDMNACIWRSVCMLVLEMGVRGVFGNDMGRLTSLTGDCQVVCACNFEFGFELSKFKAL